MKAEAIPRVDTTNKLTDNQQKTLQSTNDSLAMTESKSPTLSQMQASGLSQKMVESGKTMTSQSEEEQKTPVLEGWINAHTQKVKDLEIEAAKNPEDKKIQKLLKQEKECEERVANYIKTLQENDAALYEYIKGLEVQDPVSGKMIKLKVYVSSNPAAEGEKGQVAQTVLDRDGKFNPEIKVNYKGNAITPPQGTRGYNTIDITIYGNTTFGDERLSDEAGDIMYFMEHNEKAILENNGKDMNEGGKAKYLKSASREYSDRVSKVYKSRKQDGTGKDPKNNPYPIPEKQP